MQALQQSRNATDYIGKMMMSMFKNVGEYTLKLSQDIVRYKGTLSYKYLERALGKDTVENIARLNGFAYHRYGLFINSFNNIQDRDRIKQLTADAYAKQEVSLETMMMIDGIKDFRKAAMILAFEKNKVQKLKEKEAELLHQRQMEAAQLKHQQVMQQIQLKGDLAVQAKDREGQWYYQALVESARERREGQESRQEHESEKQTVRTDNEIRRDNNKANLEAQKSIA